MKHGIGSAVAIGLCLGMVALGCDDTRYNDSNVDTHGNQDSNDDDVRSLAACAAVTSVPLTQLSSDANTFKVSPCGHVAFTEGDTKRLVLTRPDQRELTALAQGVRELAFARTGDMLAYQSLTDDEPSELLTTVRNLTQKTEYTEPTSSGRLGFGLDTSAAEPRSIPWLCGSEIMVLHDVAWQTPDAGLGCSEFLAASAGKMLVYSNGEDGMRSLDTASLATQTVEGLSYSKLHADTSFRDDGFMLSDDGSMLLHQVIRQEYCGDTVCEYASPTTSVYDLERNVALGSVNAYVGDERLNSRPVVIPESHAMLFSKSVLAADRSIQHF